MFDRKLSRRRNAVSRLRIRCTWAVGKSDVMFVVPRTVDLSIKKRYDQKCSNS